jgi:adenosylmethionine-8-amino-7-oxononanoate aminotransferase
VAASRRRGAALLAGLRDALGDHAIVGDVRGVGLLAAVELVADRGTKAPFPAADRVAARVTAAAKQRGLLVYPSTGCAGGTDGDLVLLGPPLSITAEEVDLAVERLASAIDFGAG